MANSLANIQLQILARALMILRAKNSMPQMVNSDFSVEASKKGATIDIPLYEKEATVSDVTPSPTESAFVDDTPGLVQITMDNWKKVAFHLTDKELVEIESSTAFIPQELQRSVEGLARYVNQHLMSMYKGIYGFVGTPGVTPFSGVSGTTPATQSRMLMNVQMCPDDGRRFGMLDPVAEAAALELTAFQSAEKAGGTDVIVQGQIGRKFGCNWYWDHDVPYHTAGSATNAVVTGANAAALGERTSTISISTGAGGSLNLNEGDVITIAGHQYTYAVSAGPGIGTTAALGAGAAGNVTIAPGLRTATVGGEDIAVKGSHRVNLMFHRAAIGLAWRPLVQNTIQFSGGNDIMTMQDPLTGLVLRLEMKRVNKAVVWEIDALWGAKLVRPQYAVRIAG